MELTVLLPLLSEILKHPGSFFEKIVLIVFAAIAFKFSVRGHFRKVEDQLAMINKTLGNMGLRLDEGAKIHKDHEQRIDKLEIRINSGNTAAT